MRIMFCIGTLANGGAERVICNLSNNFVKNDDIKIVSLARTEIAYKLDKKVEVEFLDKNFFNNKLPKKNRITKNIKRLVKLKKSIKLFKPDIIVSFLPEPSFLVLILKKINKIPVIVSVRNDPKIEYQSRIYNILMKKLYPSADGIVYQTDDAKEYFHDMLKCPQVVIPNPINEEFIMPEFKGIRKKVIVNVGRLQEQKNQEVLIKAFSLIEKEFSEFNLIIYGDGILRKKLEDLIKSLNLENRIILAGTTKNIKEKIYDSSLFVLSSNYEGMPNALMEAMTLGLPVISTDCPCGGPRFLIQTNKNGILVPVNDVNALANSMKTILNDNELSIKLQRNARNISIDLSPTKINNNWRNFIGKIYNKNKR